MTRVLLTEQQEMDLGVLAERCHVSINNLLVLSLSFLDWAVTEKENGREIASVDMVARNVRTLRMPIIDTIAPLTPTPPRRHLTMIQGDRKD